jgi:homoserine O-acetyltransferase/O-succinyltransferase
VNLHLDMLKKGLGVESVACVVGGSLGGMQALEWSLLGGEDFVRSAIVIACGAKHTAWQIGISETQRQAIYADPNWNGGEFARDTPPTSGLAVARQIAMFSYRTPHGFHAKFGRDTSPDGKFQVSTTRPVLVSAQARG